MNKKDKILITLSVLYPLILYVVISSASPFLFYLYIILGIILCVYWAFRFFKGNSRSLDKNRNTTVETKEQNVASVADELLKWNDLKDKGAITEDEYQKEKSKLLNRDD